MSLHAGPDHGDWGRFQDQPVAAFGGSENNFVNGPFLKHIQFEGHPLAVQFSDQRGITGIWTIRIEVVFEEVEKRG
jgi:hypothetical protein